MGFGAEVPEDVGFDPGLLEDVEICSELLEDVDFDLELLEDEVFGSGLLLRRVMLVPAVSKEGRTTDGSGLSPGMRTT